MDLERLKSLEFQMDGIKFIIQELLRPITDLGLFYPFMFHFFKDIGGFYYLYPLFFGLWITKICTHIWSLLIPGVYLMNDTNLFL